jgi:hypothetical protein
VTKRNEPLLCSENCGWLLSKVFFLKISFKISKKIMLVKQENCTKAEALTVSLAAKNRVASDYNEQTAKNITQTYICDLNIVLFTDKMRGIS